MKLLVTFIILKHLGFALNSGLVVRWPFQNSVVDVVQGVALTVSSGVSYTQNHLGQSNSAFAFSTSKYGTAPSNFYLYGGAFTISVWAYVISISNTFEAMLDFGLAMDSDNVWFGFYKTGSQVYLRLLIWYGTASDYMITTSSTVQLNSWNFLTATHSGTEATLYINGIVGATQSMSPPHYISRTSNFVGSSNWGEQLTSSKLDDLRIYNRLLSSGEITALMNLGNLNVQIQIVSIKITTG